MKPETSQRPNHAMRIIAAMVVLISVGFCLRWSNGIVDEPNVDIARGILAFATLITMTLLISQEKRPFSEFGLMIPDNWQRRLVFGLGSGCASYLACLGLLAWVGELNLQANQVMVVRFAKGTFEGLCKLPAAALFVFWAGGYWSALFRERFGTFAGISLVGLLLGAWSQSTSSVSPAWSDLQALVGVALIAALIAVIQIRQPDLTWCVGLVTGWLMIRRAVDRVGLFDTADYTWLTSAREIERSPYIWLSALVAVGVLYCCPPRPQKAQAQPESIVPSFKRFLPFTNLLALAPLDLWLMALLRARLRVSLVSVPRLLWILAVSTMNTILTIPERILLPILLRHPVRPPIFIVGVHRSGTTHLHNLLSLDSQFRTPRNFEVLNPYGALFSGYLLMPWLALLAGKRPQDSVRIGPMTPQEDEFALAGLSPRSPFWGMMNFPKDIEYYDRYILPQNLRPSSQKAWKRKMLLFMRILTFRHRHQTPLIKNPFHTGRIRLLRELFPAAKFIHIHRHPFTVYRSNMHFAREALPVFQVQEPNPKCCYETRLLDNFKDMERAYAVATADMPRCDHIEVSFEALERDPIGVIRQIYLQLGIEYQLDFQHRLEQYLNSIRGYQKNQHRPLDDQTQQEISNKLGTFMTQRGYHSSERRAA